MNIILSTKEKHPITQAEIQNVVDLNEKKVLFVYGLAGSRGDNHVSSSSMGDTLAAHVASLGLSVYNPEDEGDDRPALEDTVKAFWEREGFQVACVGISKNVRISKTASDYKALLSGLFTKLFS